MKKLLSTLCVTIILLSTISVINAEQQPQSHHKTKLISCIIELTTPSIVEYTKMIKAQKMNTHLLGEHSPGYTLKQKVMQYKQNLIKLHQKIKNIVSGYKGNNKLYQTKDLYTLINGLTVQIPPSLIPTLKKLPFVKKIHPNSRVHTLLNASIPLINVDKVWNLTDETGQPLTGKNVTIAIIDTGVDYTHPDITSSYAGGYDFANTVDMNNDGDLDDRYNLDPNGSYHEWDFKVDKNRDGDLDDNYSLAEDGNYSEEDIDPMDDNGHGTHCAGILVGDGTASGYKYRGVAPDAKLYVYKALDYSGAGCISNIIAAIEKAVDPNGDGDTSDHRDIISLSIGIVGNEGDPDDILSQTVDNAVDAGAVVVVAAGNDGPTRHTIVSPACARKVITVGASTHLSNSYPSGGPDHVAVYSARGPSKIYSIKPDVVAPGGDVNKNSFDPIKRYVSGVISTLLRGKNIGKKISQYYTRLGGTSMACPHVAGIAALIKQKHPDWSPMEIKAALRYTAKDIGYPMTDQGFGRVDAFAAVNLSSPPPVAFLYGTGKVYSRKISIKGVAAARDFLNYEIYYKYIGEVNVIDSFEYPGEWKKIYEGENQVVDDVLYSWNTSLLPHGWYLIKLVVKDKMQRESFDLMFVSKRLRIEAPTDVVEGERFTVNLIDETGNPIKGLMIFTAPFRVPQIRFGAKAVFIAYPLLRGRVEKINAVIHAYVFSNRLNVVRKTISIHNS
ncbi:MAG TPA: hypothetical protein ENI45_02720 [Thermoplasmatales archaeon]|nr:hypothetical protein [Thermoplasmatales archaeon]